MIRRTLPTLILLAFSVITVFGQELPRPVLRMPNPRIETRYDRFKDFTAVRLIGNPVANLSSSTIKRLHLSAFGIYSGQTLTAPEGITLVLSSTSEDWFFLKGGRGLRAILNGEERLDLGTMDRANGTIRSGFVTEQLSLEITPKLLIKLATAKKIEMQLGSVEFELTETQIDDLYDFALAILPAPSRSK